VLACFAGCTVGLGDPQRLPLGLTVASSGVAVLFAETSGGGCMAGVWEAACDTVVYPGPPAEASLSWI
jgi:hypothetical protein